jgi:hypothetical protein
VHWYIYTHIEILAVTIGEAGLLSVKHVRTLRGERIEKHPFEGHVVIAAVKGMAFDALLALESIPQECEKDDFRLKIQCGNIVLFTDTIMRIDAVGSFDVEPSHFHSLNSLPPASSARKGGAQPTSSIPPPTRRDGSRSSGNPPPLPTPRAK